MKRHFVKIILACTLVFSTGIFVNRNISVQAFESTQAILDKFGDTKIYYTKGGESFHLSAECPRLSRSTVLSGPLKNIINSHSDPCDVCTEKIISQNLFSVDSSKLKIYLENSYKKAFDREMDEEGLNYWMSQFTEGNITMRGFIKNLIDTDEFEKMTQDPVEKIKRLYEVIFMRDADAEGLEYWVKILNENMKIENSRKAIILTVERIMEADELKNIVKDLGILY